MTLIEHPGLVQGSEQWLEARRGLLTASTIGKLITPKTIKAASNDESRGLIATLAAERISGWSESVYVNHDMQRGTDEEPRARDHYSKHHAPVTEVGFMVREEADYRLGYSPDGLVGDDGLIEIKAPRAKGHVQTVRTNTVPLHNMAQLQAALFVTGREWIDFCSWCGGLPMFVKRVGPDSRWFDVIEEVAVTFEQNVTQMVDDFEQATYGLPATERVVELEMSF